MLAGSGLVLKVTIVTRGVEKRPNYSPSGPFGGVYEPI